MSIRALPDEHPVYVPGHGETTLGAIREAERNPALIDTLAATLDMWGEIATRNLCREPWQNSGDGRPGPRA